MTSDRSSRGERDDIGGLLLCDLLAAVPAGIESYRVVPDKVAGIRAALRGMLARGGIRMILTTGGTGVAPRDVTPEATAPFLERDLPALSMAIRRESLRKAPASVISRALAGMNGDCLIVNLPGSPRAVRECFDVILPTLRILAGS